jgi:hypothetical protein
MHPAQRIAGAAHLVDLGGGFDEDRQWRQSRYLVCLVKGMASAMP